MRHFRSTVALSVVALAVSLAPAAASPDVPRAGEALTRGSSVHQSLRGGTLTTSPATYVGGQAVTFTGSLGVAGVRQISLQLHMNRPGDKWFAVRGFSGKTASNGSFSFGFQAPAMFGIRYRVVSGKLATAPVTFNAKAQDMTMWVVGDQLGGALDLVQPVAGLPFTIAVDTTPSLFRRPETIGLPVFAGRGLTLQRRVDGDTWESLGRSSVGLDGMGYFPGVTAPAGTVVYRVVADDIGTGANRIGWMQTFPTYVTVREVAMPTEVPIPTEVPTTSQKTSRSVAPQPGDGTTARRGAGAASATASSRYGWYPTLWDYSWESGQSLTSPPDLGSVRTGSWLDYADGAGRVSRHNGGIYLDSQRNNGGGVGDFGTTRATLTNSAQAYGRWEARLRLKSAESGAPDFKVLVELVPERAEDYACGRRNITLAEVAAHSNTLTFGAKADTAQWSGTKRIPSLIATSPAVAVEVAKGHITWFWDGKPIGTVVSKAAVSDVPMTLRFSMVGDQATERNQTAVISDWQRGFALGSGKQVIAGPRLKMSGPTSCES